MSFQRNGKQLVFPFPGSEKTVPFRGKVSGERGTTNPPSEPRGSWKPPNPVAGRVPCPLRPRPLLPSRRLTWALTWKGSLASRKCAPHPKDWCLSHLRLLPACLEILFFCLLHFQVFLVSVMVSLVVLSLTLELTPHSQQVYNLATAVRPGYIHFNVV